MGELFDFGSLDPKSPKEKDKEKSQKKAQQKPRKKRGPNKSQVLLNKIKKKIDQIQDPELVDKDLLEKIDIIRNRLNRTLNQSKETEIQNNDVLLKLKHQNDERFSSLINQINEITKNIDKLQMNSMSNQELSQASNKSIEDGLPEGSIKKQVLNVIRNSNEDLTNNEIFELFSKTDTPLSYRSIRFATYELWKIHKLIKCIGKRKKYKIWRIDDKC